MQSPKRYDFCIFGAGISGLSMAWTLKQAGFNVVVLEKERDAGGVIKTRSEEGFMMEWGPNSTMATSDKVLKMIKDIGLEDRIAFANKLARNRYIVRGGKLQALPMSPPALITSRLLTFRGKLRLIGEIFVKARKDGADESLAQFVERRLGKEALTYLINPFVAGVYAGKPEDLCVRTAFKRLYALEQNYGGMIRGGIAKAREKRKDKTTQVKDPSKAGLFSFDKGMQVLPMGLWDKLADEVKTQCEAESITREDDFYIVHYKNRRNETEQFAASQIIFTTPSYVTAKYIEKLDAALATTLHGIRYARIACVFHGFKKETVKHSLNGFGMLIPEIEKRKILGSLWNSTLFPGRAPEGHALLSTFIGGERHPDMVLYDDEDLQKIALQELDDLLGFTQSPVFTSIHRVKKAIPQYRLGHTKVIADIEAFEQANPGLHIRGNYRNGISVVDCIDKSIEFAEELAGKTIPVAPVFSVNS